MSGLEVIEGLRGRGFTLVVAECGGLEVSPASELTPEDRAAIRAHKAELLELLTCPNSPPAEENPEPHDSALVISKAGLELCPVCHNVLCEEPGKLFIHRWCATAGHFDSWRTKNELKLKQTDAPITRRPRASLPAGAEQITAQAE